MRLFKLTLSWTIRPPPAPRVRVPTYTGVKRAEIGTYPHTTRVGHALRVLAEICFLLYIYRSSRGNFPLLFVHPQYKYSAADLCTRKNGAFTLCTARIWFSANPKHTSLICTDSWVNHRAENTSPLFTLTKVRERKKGDRKVCTLGP